MTVTSSIPPPLTEYMSPFPSNMPRNCCCLTQEPIDESDEIVFLPLRDGIYAPAKLENIFSVLNISSSEEKAKFDYEFLALDLGKKVLVWHKLPKRRPDLFQLLLGHFSAH